MIPMATELTDFGEQLRYRKPIANAYADILRPDEATSSGEYQKNKEGIKKPLLPVVALPRPKQIV
jgi:hypothetical protein